MMFDGPIFADEDDVKNGWVNVGLYKDYQSLGLCWGTREVAVMNAGPRVVYRIHVKVKQSCQR